jgi:hypothetical protein
MIHGNGAPGALGVQDDLRRRSGCGGHDVELPPGVTRLSA